MSVSGVGSSVNVYVPQPPTAKVAKQSQTAAATVTTSTPSVAAATPSSPTPPAAAPASTTPAPAPKVDPIKLAIKESTEPVTLLTQQAKHGDVVAKLLLKQITQKAAAKQALTAKPQAAAASAVEEGSETEATAEKPGAAASPASSESSASNNSAGPAEAGKGELVDQKA